jgi:tripartite-type tricarboxylate transporter receptor subunit TctC
MFISAASWLEVKTLPELIALAKKKPGELTYGANGVGRLTHLTGELLATRTSIKLLMVPYSGGTSQVLADVMGKRISLVMDGYSGLSGAIQAGNLVPLAVASATRLPSFPDLPTAAETVAGFEAGGWSVMLAPVGTPESIVQKVNSDLIRALSGPETHKLLERFHRDERRLSPAATLAFIKSEQKRWAPVLKQIAQNAN